MVDDDVRFPRAFLGSFLACAEGIGLQLAQPAHRHTSHAAWSVTRRERWTLARRTRLVEIGPVTAFHSSVAAELLPFPPLRMGWGLDAHWGGLAQERGWHLGVVDATPIRHELAAARQRATTGARRSPKLRISCPASPSWSARPRSRWSSATGLFRRQGG